MNTKTTAFPRSPKCSHPGVMARHRRFVAAFFAAGALILLPSTASAGPTPDAHASGSSVIWKDPSNDAGQVSSPSEVLPSRVVPRQGGPSVLPSDPAFDVTDVTLETVGDKFKWTVKVPEMAAGMPSESTGYYFRLGFTHDGTQYQFMVVENPNGTFFFGVRPWSSEKWMTCTRCKGTINRQTKAVVVEAPIASLNRGFEGAGAPPVDGAAWSDLYVWSQRYTHDKSLTADTANAPANTVFAF